MVIVYVFVVPFSAVTTTVLVLCPTTREIDADAVPDAVLLPFTEIVATFEELVGVIVIELEEFGKDKLYEVVELEKVCKRVPAENTKFERLASEDADDLVTVTV